MTTSRRRICVVTGTRADYGLLYWVMREIEATPSLELQIVATAMHIAPAFGETWRQIEADGFRIDEKVEMLLASDTRVGTAKSMGLGIAGMADAFTRLAPDVILVLGDRFEILAAAQTATLLGIPLAHIAGGDTTEGAFDEAMRHAITKMAHVHFVTNSEAARRVRQLGEDPARVHQVGSPGIDYIQRLEPMTREELERNLGFRFRERNLLITFHPTTIGDASATEQVRELLTALEGLGEDVGLWFTMPNADPAANEIISAIKAFTTTHENAAAFVSLGQQRYLSLMRYVDAVVGNSSSGLAEAPSFGIPAVNVGDRQKGRLMAESVVSCACKADEISAAIAKAFTLDCRGVVNPYGSGDAAKAIARILGELAEPRALLQKRFFDVHATTGEA